MHSILKFVFFEIQNKEIRPVLSGPVTYDHEDLCNLEYLNCSHIKLTEINLFSTESNQDLLLPKLTSLDISNNEFTDLPMGFDRFTELKYLYINNKPRVTHIPRDIGYICHLNAFEYHDVADPVTAALNDISCISNKLTYLRSMQQRYVATIPIAICVLYFLK